MDQINMPKYADPWKLGQLLNKNEDALKYVAQRHPAEIRRWLALRKRMGRNCPMARGVLKLIAYKEGDNEKLLIATENGEWNEQ